MDDAFLYRFVEGEYLLVVNASNRIKDLEHLRRYAESFDGVELIDRTYDIAMFALQGPKSRDLLEVVVDATTTSPTAILKAGIPAGASSAFRSRTEMPWALPGSRAPGSWSAARVIPANLSVLNFLLTVQTR